MSIRATIKNNSRSARLIFFFSLLTLTIMFLASMPRIALPLGFAYILSFLLRPFIPALTKFVRNRDVAIGILFLLLGFLIVYPIVKVAPVIQEETDNLQYYVPKVKTFLQEKYSVLRFEVEDRAGLELPEDAVDNAINIAEESISSFILQIPNLLASVLEWLFLVPLFLFFFIRDGRKLLHRFLKYVPNQIFERTYYLFSEFNRQIGDYIFAKFVEASIVGLIITVGLFVIDVRFAFLLGILAGVTNIIPYLGPVLGVIPALIVAFIDFGFSPGFGAVVILYTVANVIDLAFVFPILVSKIVNLHPLVVVLSVMLGSQYMGVAGMIISIPLAASAKLIVIEIFKEIYPETSRGS